MARKVAKLELRNVRVLGWRNLVSVAIEGGMITHVGERLGWKNVHDCRGYSLFPGRVDMHVHDRDPDGKGAENCVSVQRAAIAGGTTTICTMANTDPCITDADRWWEKDARIRRSRITHLQWGGATPTNHNEFVRLKKEARFKGVKLCTAITTSTENMLIDKKEDKRTWCSWAAEHDVLLTCHLENQARISRNEKRLLRKKLELGLQHHCDIREPLCEEEEVSMMINIALKTGCRLHVCHVSSPRSVVMIRAAQKKGARITFEFCPQYWRRNSDYLLGPDGWQCKFNPAVPSPEDAQQMRRFVCDETIMGAVIATDHAPHRIQKKLEHFPDPLKVPSGMPGLDTCTLVCWELVASGEMSPEHFTNLTSYFPAQILGLTTKGKIELGYDADLILIDEQGSTLFEDHMVKTKCGWTPFHGERVPGEIVLVMSGGNVLLNKL